MPAKPFLITGMLRSGTTLLQNCLNQIEGITCSNQRFTSLFLNAKTAFLNQAGIKSYHVLSNYFPSNHTSEQFSNFLQLSDFKNEFKIELSQNGLHGNKEVLVEEFLPYLSKHYKIILILRNPLDVITSLHYGKFEKYAGKHRPILFDIRNWRKSVAFSILLKNNPNIFIIRYEDLIWSFDNKIKEILNFLTGSKLKISDYEINSIKSTLGKNSSFESHDGLYTDSISHFRQYLPKHIISFMMTCCFPEMKYLGYNVEAYPEIFPVIDEPFPITRKEFSDFDHQKEVKREIKRLELLQEVKPISKNQTREYFIFSEAYDTLKAYY